MNGFRTYRPDERRGPGIASPLDMVEGILQTGLPAAGGITGKNANAALTGSKTATLNLIEWSDADTFYLTGKTATITNRSDQFSAGPGSYLVAFKIGGEFRPLPSFQTLRGRLMRTLQSDDVIGWPKFSVMEVLGVGRVFGIVSSAANSAAFTITSTTASTIVVSGDVSAAATVGRFVAVSGAGDADGTYTVSSSSFSSPDTTINVVETVASSTIDSNSAAYVLGSVTFDAVPRSSALGLSADATDLVHVGDVVTLWGDDTSMTVVAVSYNGTTHLTTITITEDVSAAITPELAAVTVSSIPDGNRFVVSGDVRPDCITGHVVNVTGCGGANGRYTIFGTSYAGTSTTIIVSEQIPSGTAGGTLTILRSLIQNTIHPDSRLTYGITGITVGDPGAVTIANPDTVLTSGDPIDNAEMFLEFMQVELTGSNNGENDGTYRCRKAFKDNGSTITVYLDGPIVTSTGALGSLTLKVPPPLCVKSKALAVLRWYRALIFERSIIHTLPPDGDGWCEIIAADVGPSDPAEPDDLP